jgi:uncharacterized protein (TIGR00251 family)
MHGESLKVRLAAPPVNGAANETLITLLAAELGVAKRAVRIVSGASSRNKIVEVDGIGVDVVECLAARAQSS